MAIFNGKIVDAKFIDRKKTMIEVIYKENEKHLAHSIEVDWELQDFHDLINEVELEKIETNTYNYSKELSAKRRDVTNASVKTKLEDSYIGMSGAVDALIKEVFKNRHDPAFLFKFKIEIFKLEEISNSSRWFTKRKIKKSKDAMQIMWLLSKIMK